MSEPFSKAKALRDAKGMLGEFACLSRVSSPERALRFVVGITLPDGQVMVVGRGGSWVEALEGAEQTVRDTIALENAKKAQPAE